MLSKTIQSQRRIFHMTQRSFVQRTIPQESYEEHRRLSLDPNTREAYWTGIIKKAGTIQKQSSACTTHTLLFLTLKIYLKTLREGEKGNKKQQYIAVNLFHFELVEFNINENPAIEAKINR